MKKVLIVFLIFTLGSCMSHKFKVINRAMDRYDRFVLHQNFDSIADLFLPDGELAGEKQKSIIGRDSIKRFLNAFKGAFVIKYSTQSDSNIFKFNTVIQSGNYIQVVKIPKGDTLELGGNYRCSWKKGKNGRWMIQRMYTFDYKDLKEENWLYNLPENSLAKQFGTTLLKKGSDSAKTLFPILRKDSLKYYAKESEFNHLGYHLMGKDKISEALTDFKTTIELYPNSWNAYDSYGEALLKVGNKVEAIKMYKKSIELNPQNTNGQMVLKHLE